MGLYLCVFDDSSNELEGVEVGPDADFNFFRDLVVRVVENSNPSSLCPLLNNHPDSDGEWTSYEAHYLIKELEKISQEMRKCPPVEFNSQWKKDISKTFGIVPKNMLECFFDIDGEPLVERLIELANISISHGRPILFQ